MLTRRLFLVGLGSTVAAASALARSGLVEGEAILPVPSPVLWQRRSVCDLMVSSKYEAGLGGFVKFSVERGNGNVFMQETLPRGAVFRWVARPGHELWCPPGDPIRLVVDDSAGAEVEQITLIGVDTMPPTEAFPNGEKVRFREMHRWPGPSITYTRMDASPPTENWDDIDDDDEAEMSEDERLDALEIVDATENRLGLFDRISLFGRKIF